MTRFDWIILGIIILIGVLWKASVVERTALGYFMNAQAIWYEEALRTIFFFLTGGFIAKKIWKTKSIS